MAFFPSSVATALELLEARNNKSASLDIAVNQFATTLDLDDSTPFPASGYVTFADNKEIVQYTGNAANQLTGCTRGADGTVATSHSAGVSIEQRHNAAYHNTLTDEIIAIETYLQSAFGLTPIPLLLPDGSVGAPTYSWASDPDSGIYRVGSGSLGIAVNGAPGAQISAAGIQAFQGAIVAPDGTAASPTFAFSGSVTTGLYRAAGLLGLSASGVGIATASAAGLTVLTGAFLAPNGTAGAPTFSFTGSPTDGIYKAASGVGIAAAGVLGLEVNATQQVLVPKVTDQLVLGTTNTITLTAPAPAASRTYTIPDVLAAASFVMTEGNQTINGVKTLAGANLIALADGLLATPSLYFASDIDCGIYRSASNSWNLVAGGVAVVNMVDTYFNVLLTEFHPNGSAAVPSVAFASDQTTGLYRNGAGILGISNAGVSNYLFGGSGATFSQALHVPDGTAALPGLTGVDTDTGVYFSTNVVGLATNGLSRLFIDSTKITSQLPIWNVDGAVGAPAYSFGSDTDSGIYWAGANDFRLAAGGADALGLSSVVTAYLDLVPNANVTRDLGTTALAWLNIHAKNSRFMETGGADYVQMEGPAAITTSYRVALPPDAPATVGHTMRVASLGTPNVLEWGPSGGNGVAEYVAYTVGTPSGSYSGSTTVFDLPFTYTADGKNMRVFYNGQQLKLTTDYTETSTSQITTTAPLIAGQSIWFRTVTGVGAPTSVNLYREDYVVGTALNNYTGSTTVFNLVNSYNVGGNVMLVTLDGDVQTKGASVDYLETNSTTVTFNNALVAGQKVSFIWANTNGTSGVNSGTAGQAAYYSASGGVVSGTNAVTVGSNGPNGIITGTNTNDSAAAGKVGEYVSASDSAGTNFPASTVFGDLLSISLTAGDWDVTGIVEAELNGATLTNWLMGIGLVAGNNQTGLNNGDNRVEGFNPTASSRSTYTCPGWRLSINATTTVYLKYFANYSAGTPKAYGRLSARRVR
jgi:hypothetical protein